MRLARHPLLDALCGEYLLGTMRGAARRRFERALREEPLVTSTLARWRETFATRPSPDAVPAAAELDRGWARLRRELALEPAAQPWWRRAGLWQAWAATATIALAVAVWRDAPQETPTATRPLAELADSGARGVLAASVSPDGRLLELRPSRPIVAGPAQSYELWLIPAEGGAPVSVAVLGDLAARIELPAAIRERLRPGAKLAVSVEPAGGSPTGGPTGPVILAGAIGG